MIKRAATPVFYQQFLRHMSSGTSQHVAPVARRVDRGVSAGVGALHPAGHPQHAHALPGVVAVRGGRLPGRSDQRGRAGLPVHHLRADCCSLHGKKKYVFRLFFF